MVTDTSVVLSPEHPVGTVTVTTTTITEGFSWWISAKKWARHAVTGAVGIIGISVCQWLLTNGPTLVKDYPMSSLLGVVLTGLAGAALNWFRHRDDIPSIVKVTTLPKESD